MIRVVNLKKDMPNSEYAIYCLEKEIDYGNIEKINSIIFIHGYGSHGYGGVIKQEVHKKLIELKKSKKIIDFVRGEDWSDINSIKLEMCKISPELILNNNLQNFNSGVTVVFLNRI